MNNVKIFCEETRETRTFENCSSLSEGSSSRILVQEMVRNLGGRLNSSHNSIHIVMSTDNAFHELTFFIEMLTPPSSLVKNSIVITVNQNKICCFKKTFKLKKKWNAITLMVKKCNGKVSGNTFDFPYTSKAAYFIKRFAAKFLV